ncbi:MAG: hypothetical protein HYV75_00225 [Opitutae bacterium]|nr:hypothetical protein [Opitutae bacterium]
MNYDKEPELPDSPPVSAQPRRLMGLLAVVVFVAAGLWLYWQLAVAPVAPAGPEDDGRKQMAAEISFLEGRLEILAANLARLGPDAPPDDQRKLIEEAVARQERLRRLRPVPLTQDDVRLAEWQVRLGNNHAREWNRQSQELETAGTALRGRDQPAAIEKLKEALRLQREVNRGLADQSFKNHGREARLEQEAGQLEAEPLQAEGRRLLEQAREGVAAGRWTEALELYGRARDIQLRLNREYARTRFSDLVAVDRIEAEMAALSAGEAHDQLEKLVAQATAAAATQKPGEADKLLAAAVARQQLINEQFPKSRFVSMERLEQLEADRQTLSAGAMLGEVRVLDRSAAGHLRRRELFQAQQLIGQALEKLEYTIAQRPKARGVDEELRQRLSYLNLP